PHLSFFISAPATTAIYTLSLHDALPILTGFQDRAHQVRRIHLNKERARKKFLQRGKGWEFGLIGRQRQGFRVLRPERHRKGPLGDRKSTRLNSSHVSISYAVFCLKKKRK